MNVIYADIETLAGLSLFSFYQEANERWFEFEISQYKNDLYSFRKFMEEMSKEHYFIFFNGISFDSQVIEYVLRVSNEWYDYSSSDIVGLIYRKAQDTIENARFELPPTYWEDEISFRQIDTYQIPHFANKARRCSLKWLEFMMNMPNIEEMPIPHNQVVISPTEIESIKLYCRNDILSTVQWYKYLTGEVEHKEYSGRNKVQDRLDTIAEFSLPGRAINFSDVKMGDELNKMGYCKLTGKTSNELYDLKKKRGGTKKFTFGDCIPSYVKFSTPEFKALLNTVRNIVVSLEEGKKGDQEFPFSYNSTDYLIARGGIHSQESNRVITKGSGEILRDADIGSQYPNAIVKRELYPSHLGKEWLVNYKATIARRIGYKARSSEPKYKGLSEQLKLALNGGGFGKTGERQNWQDDPRVLYYCTIGNQFEILLLIEMLESEGIRVVSANTDGITCLFGKELEAVYTSTCSSWEEIVGNSEMGKLEFQDYTKLWQESVNHYIAVKPDGELKIKGRFDIYSELHKNNTDKIERITRLAIQEWVKSGIEPKETVNNCQDIYMFCIGKKASRDYRGETINNGKRTQYQRLIRFYISKTGDKLIKVKNEGSDAPGNDITEFFRDYPVRICNRIEEGNLQEIDRQYYIDRAVEVIEKVEGRTRKVSAKVYTNPQQQSLF